MSEPKTPTEPRVLLGVSGAIAAYRAADIIRGLRRRGAEVDVALTKNAQNFVTPFLLGNLAGRPAIVDQFADSHADVRHVTAALEVDLLLIAPATADIIAKMANGLADDYITAFYLAAAAPVVVAPAMNSRMWQHPATVANVATLRARGVNFIGPVEGELATLHTGIGRLASPETIVDEALRVLGGGVGSLDGEVVLVTAGPTEEDLDLARTLTNRSTGRMGYAVAAEAAARGAETILISGPTALDAPIGVEMSRVRSAAEMQAAVEQFFPRASVLVMAAAVSDFRPKERLDRKVKKDDSVGLSLELERTPDILAEVAATRKKQILVGFAAEDGSVAERAKEKLERKGLDLVVGNDISRSDVGFAADDNEVLIVGRDAEPEQVSKRSKQAVAARILDRVETLIAERRS